MGRLLGRPSDLEKDREHVFSTAITSGWWNDVFVFILHEHEYDSGEYWVELQDVYRYNVAVNVYSRETMILDALNQFANHHTYPKPIAHKSGNGEDHGVDYGYTGFSYCDPFGGKGFSSYRHRTIAVATFSPGVLPAMIKAADKYAKSLIADADTK